MKLHDTELRYRNSEASEDLIIGVRMDAEIEQDYVKEHLEQNLKKHVPWLIESPANKVPAIVVGAAPSLLDSIEEIRKRKMAGAAIFCCNSSSKVLRKHGIATDYQVILDSGAITLDEFDPDAHVHLLASICQPALFDQSEHAVLWHPCTQIVVDRVEDIPRDFTYIGGGVTVMNSTMAIAYTMGHREIDVFGVDSSREGREFYADGRTLEDVNSQQLQIVVEHMGREYHTTYDMKQQVIVFLEIAKELQKLGVSINVHGSGLLPDVWKLAHH